MGRVGVEKWRTPNRLDLHDERRLGTAAGEDDRWRGAAAAASLRRAVAFWQRHVCTAAGDASFAPPLDVVKHADPRVAAEERVRGGRRRSRRARRRQMCERRPGSACRCVATRAAAAAGPGGAPSPFTSTTKTERSPSQST